MPRCYRVALRAYAADLSGEGARLHGGRWTPVGYPAVYTAEHPALAGFELLVQNRIAIDHAPLDFELVAIDLYDSVTMRRITHVPADPTAVGEAWLSEGKEAVLAVPSVVVPAATNYLLNPTHPPIRDASATSLGAFVFDPRLS